MVVLINNTAQMATKLVTWGLSHYLAYRFKSISPRNTLGGDCAIASFQSSECHSKENVLKMEGRVPSVDCNMTACGGI